MLAPIQVIPVWTGPALPELHGSYHEAGASTISQITVSIL
jgi:hypothetical protein